MPCYSGPPPRDRITSLEEVTQLQDHKISLIGLNRHFVTTVETYFYSNRRIFCDDQFVCRPVPSYVPKYQSYGTWRKKDKFTGLHLGRLSNDELMYVFTFLKAIDLVNMEKVCSRWQSSARSEYVWQSCAWNELARFNVTRSEIESCLKMGTRNTYRSLVLDSGLVQEAGFRYMLRGSCVKHAIITWRFAHLRSNVSVLVHYQRNRLTCDGCYLSVSRPDLLEVKGDSLAFKDIMGRIMVALIQHNRTCA